MFRIGGCNESTFDYFFHCPKIEKPNEEDNVIIDYFCSGKVDQEEDMGKVIRIRSFAAAAFFFLMSFSHGAAWASDASDSPFGFLDVPPDKYEYYTDLDTHWLRGGREKYDWADVEKKQGVYDFSSRDTGLCTFAQNGQNPVYAVRPINILYGTYWVEGNLALTDEYPDGHLADYGNFIKAWVERYDGDGVSDATCSTPIRIKHYQFVHELGPISQDYWQSHRDQYAEVFETVYAAMKEACIDCILYMPVPVMEDLMVTPNFLTMVLGALQGKGITDIGFDYHTWSMDKSTTPPSYLTDGEDYVNHGEYISKIKSIADQYGFPSSNIISAESGMAGTIETERSQAGYVVRMYIYSLSKGQKKVLWTTTKEYSHYNDTSIFAHTGLVHNPLNSDGLSHKKLAYYTYKKTVELLDGADWSGVQTIQESDDVKVYKLDNNGKSFLVGWWDWFNDPVYIPGATKQVVITGLQGSGVHITEAVPDASSGAEITDYNNAFITSTGSIAAGVITVAMGDSPVFIEIIGNPAISVSPATKDFGSIDSGTSSAAQIFTVTNSGTADITINAMSITGTDAGQFMKQSDTCSGQALSPSGSCTVQVVFAPTSSGTKAASLEVASSDPVAPTLTAALTGTGVQYTLTVAGATGSSTGTITGGSGINCSIAADGIASGACAEIGNPGSSITLTATPAAGASVSWTNCTASTGNTCTLTLDGNKTVTASFNATICQNSPVRIAKATPVYYATIQDAYNAASDGDTIQSLASDFTETLTFNRSVSVTLQGGYDCDYTNNAGSSVIKGSLTISAGTLTVNNLVLEP